MSLFKPKAPMPAKKVEEKKLLCKHMWQAVNRPCPECEYDAIPKNITYVMCECSCGEEVDIATTEFIGKKRVIRGHEPAPDTLRESSSKMKVAEKVAVEVNSRINEEGEV